VKDSHKKNITTQTTASGLDSNKAKYTILFSAVILAIGIITVLFRQGQTAVFIQRSWGMNNFSYYPIWIEILVFALLICSIVPSFNSRMIGLLESLSLRINEKGLKKGAKVMSFASIALVLTILLYVFKIKYDFLGDRDIRVGQSVKGIYAPDEFLTMYLLHYLNNIMANILHFSPHRTFVFHSIASGFVYFFTGLLIADMLFGKTQQKVIFFLFYISISTIMVFSGYVEIYAFPAASVSIYIYSCLLFLKGKTQLILPFLFLLLAIALHLEQVSLIPSFVFLVVSRYKFAEKIGVLLLVSLAIVAIPVIYVIYPVFHIDASTIVPFKPDHNNPDVFTLLSSTHFREFFNSQFLSSGILIFLFPIALYVSYRKKIALDNYSKFFLITLLYSIVIVFTDNAMMGSADWDICSFPAISASMFVSYVFLKQFDKVYSAKKISYVVIVALLFNTLNCWAWIGINSSNKSIKKIQDMVMSDPGYYYIVYMPGEIHLSATFFSDNLISEEEHCDSIAYEKYSTVLSRAPYMFAVMQLRHKDTTGAITTLEKLIQDFPLGENAMEELCILYEKKRMYTEEYNIGLLVEKEFLTDTENTLERVSKSFMAYIFNFVYSNASTIRDSYSIENSKRAIALLKQYEDGNGSN
jgi:hypothetical protein